MDEIYDPEVILISDGLNLNPKMVQDCFENTLLPARLTDEQYEAARSDIEGYNIIINSLNKVINVFESLPDIEKEIPKLTGDRVWENLQEARHYMNETLKLRNANLKRHSRARGTNRNAHFVADLVALICIKSNIPLTVGVDPIRNEPTTAYGNILQKVLKILGIKGRSDNEVHWRRLAENAKLKHKSATEEK